jgi:hypothetical protein
MILRRHKNNPMAYILGTDARKREAIENSGEARRIHKAREAKGFKNYKNIADVIKREASNLALNKLGIVRGIAEDRNRGTNQIETNRSLQDKAY